MLKLILRLTPRLARTLASVGGPFAQRFLSRGTEECTQELRIHSVH